MIISSGPLYSASQPQLNPIRPVYFGKTIVSDADQRAMNLLETDMANQGDVYNPLTNAEAQQQIEIIRTGSTKEKAAARNRLLCGSLELIKRIARSGRFSYSGTEASDRVSDGYIKLQTIVDSDYLLTHDIANYPAWLSTVVSNEFRGKLLKNDMAVKRAGMGRWVEFDLENEKQVTPEDDAEFNETKAALDKYTMVLRRKIMQAYDGLGPEEQELLYRGAVGQSLDEIRLALNTPKPDADQGQPTRERSKSSIRTQINLAKDKLTIQLAGPIASILELFPDNETDAQKYIQEKVRRTVLELTPDETLVTGLMQDKLKKYEGTFKAHIHQTLSKLSPTDRESLYAFVEARHKNTLPQAVEIPLPEVTEIASQRLEAPVSYYVRGLAPTFPRQRKQMAALLEDQAYNIILSEAQLTRAIRDNILQSGEGFGQIVDTAFESLHPQDRELMKRKTLGQGYARISEDLGITVTSARTEYYTAKGRFKTALAEPLKPMITALTETHPDEKNLIPRFIQREANKLIRIKALAEADLREQLRQEFIPLKDAFTTEVSAGLQTLSPQHQELLIRDAQGQSGGQISKDLGILINSVWGELCVSRAELRETLNEHLTNQCTQLEPKFPGKGQQVRSLMAEIFKENIPAAIRQHVVVEKQIQKKIEEVVTVKPDLFDDTIRTAFEKIPAQFQKILKLTALGHTPAEIAESEGLQERSVTTEISQAGKAMEAEMDADLKEKLSPVIAQFGNAEKRVMRLLLPHVQKRIPVVLKPYAQVETDMAVKIEAILVTQKEALDTVIFTEMPKFTDRDLQLVKRYTQGEAPKEMAKSLGINTHSVYDGVTQIRKAIKTELMKPCQPALDELKKAYPGRERSVEGVAERLINEACTSGVLQYIAEEVKLTKAIQEKMPEHQPEIQTSVRLVMDGLIPRDRQVLYSRVSGKTRDDISAQIGITVGAVSKLLKDLDNAVWKPVEPKVKVIGVQFPKREALAERLAGVALRQEIKTAVNDYIAVEAELTPHLQALFEAKRPAIQAAIRTGMTVLGKRDGELMRRRMLGQSREEIGKALDGIGPGRISRIVAQVEERLIAPARPGIAEVEAQFPEHPALVANIIQSWLEPELQSTIKASLHL
jgi:DNA-directed RNA polymerase specialized sigma24 family protein